MTFIFFNKASFYLCGDGYLKRFTTRFFLFLFLFSFSFFFFFFLSFPSFPSSFFEVFFYYYFPLSLSLFLSSLLFSQVIEAISLPYRNNVASQYHKGLFFSLSSLSLSLSLSSLSLLFLFSFSLLSFFFSLIFLLIVGYIMWFS